MRVSAVCAWAAVSTALPVLQATGQESQRDGGGFPLNAHADFEHMPLGKASCKPGLSTVESSEYADDDFDSASSYADDFDE